MHRELNHVLIIKSRDGFEQTIGNKNTKTELYDEFNIFISCCFFFKYIFVLFVKKEEKNRC